LNSTTQINAADFPRRYPSLFALYAKLMAVTTARVQAEQQALTVKFDGQVAAAQSRYADAEALAVEAYQQVQQPADQLCRSRARQSSDTLNAALPVLLDNKAQAMSKVGGEGLNDELLRLRQESAADEACYRELGLHQQAAQRAVQCQQDVSAVMARYQELHRAADQVYQRLVAEAFALHNENLRQARADYNAVVDGPELELKRKIRAAEQARHEELTAIAWRRDEETQALQSWVAAVKEARLQCIRSFLADPCEVTLKGMLEESIAELSA